MEYSRHIVPALIAVAYIAIPIIYFCWKDKTAPNGLYTLSRGKYFLWTVFAFSSIWIYSLWEGGNFGSRYAMGRENIVCWGLFISLTYIISRRMADVGWSRSMCVTAIISQVWIGLFFIRGKARPALAPKTSMPPILIMQNNQSYGPYELKDLLDMWDKGQIAGNALYRHEGRTAYKPLAADIEKLRMQVR